MSEYMMTSTSTRT